MAHPHPPTDPAGGDATAPRQGPSRVARARDAAWLVWRSLGLAVRGLHEDNVFFMAGGIAFNILLAVLPFVLLVVAGLTLVLGLSPEASAAGVRELLDRLLPASATSAGSPLNDLVDEIVRTRSTAGIYGALTYVWFSARLFGSLRTVLSMVFDRERDRGILLGKWFDIRLTVYSSALLAAWVVLSLYLAVARSRQVELLVALGLRADVMGVVEYALGRLIAFLFIVGLFYAMYQFLPQRRVRWQQALIGALCAGLLFEVARNAWTALTASFDPGSLYSGTLYAIVSVVFWVYYAALIFILGGEVAQGHELARAEQRVLGGAPGAEGRGTEGHHVGGNSA